MAEEKFNSLVDKVKDQLLDEQYTKNINEKVLAKFPSLSEKKRVDVSLYHNYAAAKLLCRNLIVELIPHIYRLQNIDKFIDLFFLAFKGNTKSKNEFIQIYTDISSPDYFLQYTGFIVYGCPLSTDIDVAVITNNLKHLHKPIDYQELRSDLNILGYSPDKELDVVTIFIDGDKVADYSKGGAELHNIIVETFKYHKQMFDICPVVGHRDIDIVDMIRALAKFIIDNFKFMLPEQYYKKIRDQKIKAYAGEWSRVEFVNQHYPNIMIKVDSKKEKDVYKSLMIKLCQLLLVEDGEYEYTKQGLANKFGPGAAWFLTRGQQGEKCMAKSSLFILLNDFYRLSLKYKPIDMIWHDLPVNLIKNPTELDDQLYKEFINSPDECTDRFSELFKAFNPDRYEGVIGSAFKIRSQNVNCLPQWLRDLVYDCDQRSEEWQKLLKYHTCGRNSGIEPYEGDDWVKFYYNLIRGCIGELMVIHNADFSVVAKNCDFDKIVVGMMVQEKIKGSMGISPDLLLRIGSNIFPVEIKCVMYPPSDNSEMRSRIKLAKLELQSSAKILQVTRGIIVMLHIYQDQDDWIYNCQYCWVDF